MADRQRTFCHRRLCALLLLTVVGGCETRLTAPRLEDGPVYKNQREGFRFFVPDGWKQRARGEVPPGKVTTERMLAEYKCLNCSGSLRVSVADVPLSTPLGDYITKNTFTGEKWRLLHPAEEFTINGEPAARILYSKGSGREEVFREVVAFRRDERVYFFKSFYAAWDVRSRKALRAAVETIVW